MVLAPKSAQNRAVESQIKLFLLVLKRPPETTKKKSFYTRFVTLGKLVSNNVYKHPYSESLTQRTESPSFSLSAQTLIIPAELLLNSTITGQSLFLVSMVDVQK